MRTLVPLCVFFAGCSCANGDDDDDDDGDDTDTTPPYTTIDTSPDSGSGIGGDTDTDAEPVNPCGEGSDPVHIKDGASFTEVQAALDAAPAGAEIYLCRGTYAGPFVAPLPVKLIGIDGADFTILDGRGMGTTLTLQPTSSLDGIRVTGGSAIAGGGLVLTGAGSYEISASAILSNTAEEGGGIWAAPGARIFLPDTVVADNHADRGGGIYADIGVDLDLSHGRIQANVAEDNGGGIYALAGFAMFGGEVTLNTVLATDDTSGGGGLALVGDGSLMAANITTNGAHRGGGLRVDDAALLTLTDVALDDNVATDLAAADGRGGGLYAQGGQVVMTGLSSITGNEADLGGGAFVTADGALNGAFVTANVAVSGGGVYLQDATASMVTVNGNTADSGGGVVIDDAGMVSASTVSTNLAIVDGGGVLAGAWLADSLGAGVLELSALTVSDNDAATGGGIAVTGDVTLSVTDASIVETNAALAAGGGAWVAETATFTSDTSGWGDGPLDNVPDDVVAGTTSYTGYTAAETFTCASGACDPAP